MELSGINVRQLWHNIKIIIVKTVLAMVPEIMLNYEHCFCDSPGPQCFQVQTQIDNVYGTIAVKSTEVLNFCTLTGMM